MRRFFPAVFVLALLVGLTPASRASEACSGDCDGDGRVTVAELIRGVGCALSPIPESDCSPCFAAPISIASVIGAVHRSLLGCPLPAAPPTATAIAEPAEIVLILNVGQRCSPSPIVPITASTIQAIIDSYESCGGVVLSSKIEDVGGVTCNACGCPLPGGKILTLRVIPPPQPCAAFVAQ